MFTSKIMTLAGGLAVCFLFPLSCNISTCPATIHYSRIHCTLSWLNFPRHYSDCQRTLSFCYLLHSKEYITYTLKYDIIVRYKSRWNHIWTSIWRLIFFFYYGFTEIVIELTNWITEFSCSFILILINNII